MIILGNIEESEKQLSHLLKNPFPDICKYTLWYVNYSTGNKVELTFEWLQVTDMDAVKEMGDRVIRRTYWSKHEDVGKYRFLKYEEKKIKGYINNTTVPVNPK
jgi:hypothetical protein